MDELPGFTPVHQRKTLAQLLEDPASLKREMTLIKEALPRCPRNGSVKNEELRNLLDVTCQRIEHSLWIRRAIEADYGIKAGLDRMSERVDALSKAKEIRKQALSKMNVVIEKFQRYPEAKAFLNGQEENLTSYDFGYLWTAATLHFWEREEMMIPTDSYKIPFYMNIYRIDRIIN